MTLDERILTAISLYEACEVGADIGTDHAYLPAELLRRGICRRMLLCDVSPSALNHARQTVERFHLQSRTRLFLSDGLEQLDEPCGCVSIMGMGGETMAGILHRGADKLNGAVLVLSAHTEQEAVRRTVCDLGYHFTRSVLCQAAGRLYLMWRCEPGVVPLSEEDIRRDPLLWQKPNSLTAKWAERHLLLTEERLKGMTLRGASPEAMHRLEEDRNFYHTQLKA